MRVKVGFGGVRLNAIEMQDSLKKLLDIIADILQTDHDDINRGDYKQYEKMRDALRYARNKIEEFVNTIPRQKLVENDRGTVFVDWLGRKSAIMSEETEQKFLNTRGFTGEAVIEYILKETDFPLPRGALQQENSN